MAGLNGSLAVPSGAMYIAQLIEAESAVEYNTISATSEVRGEHI
jgi:hypothetical protein